MNVMRHGIPKVFYIYCFIVGSRRSLRLNADGKVRSDALRRPRLFRPDTSSS